jgi:dolichol kinase
MLIFILLYLRVSRQTMLIVYGSLFFIALIVEILRWRRPEFHSWFEKTTGALLRSHEREHWTGATFLFLSSFLTVLLFERWIAITALLFVVVSDALSALVGKRWGKHRIWGDRTVEGTIVFLFSAVLLVLINPHLPLLIGLAGVLIALYVEIFVQSLDDNLTVPLCSGLMMQLVAWITTQGNA